MLPEISRRCLSCGAAVRAGTRFCPQCGKPLEAEAAPGASEESRVETPRASVPPTGEWSPQEKVAPKTKDWTPPTKEFAAFEPPPGVSAATAAPPAPEPVAAVAEEAEPESREEASAGEEAGRAGDLRGRVARVREGTKARVGRMREEAIVALEETPDDSGLRFVLAAAALFVLFLVLLFLSTTVMR